MEDNWTNILITICEMQDEFAFSEWRLSQKVSLSLLNFNPPMMADRPYIETYHASAMLHCGEPASVGSTLFRLSATPIHHRQ